MIAQSPPSPASTLSRFAPSRDDLERLSRYLLTLVPVDLKGIADNLLLKVEEFPDDETVEIMALGSNFDLLGLYRKASLPEASVVDIGAMLDILHIYRRPLLDYWCESGEALDKILMRVIIHELQEGGEAAP